jgi:glycosyltransferase involved in cell wall biosynthesis
MPMRSRLVAIIGSHGLYAKYGGWDFLVNALAERHASDIRYVIFNSRDTPVTQTVPPGVRVWRLPLRANGWEGMVFDFVSILLCLFRVDGLLLLGAQGMPLLALLRPLWRPTLVVNVDGIEWERPKFGRLMKWYFRWCFQLSLRLADTVVLDNEYFRTFVGGVCRARVMVIPYGATIDQSLEPNGTLVARYPFLADDYLLAVGRSIEDNRLDDLCAAFAGTPHRLVLVSNFSSTAYGRGVLDRYRHVPNLTLIDGIWDKPELDLIRRRCTAYIHTHTLCGTAPTLVEMIVAQKPVLAVDVPQNRFTLKNHGAYFTSAAGLPALFEQYQSRLADLVPPASLARDYGWDLIVRAYEEALRGAVN